MANAFEYMARTLGTMHPVDAARFSDFVLAEMAEEDPKLAQYLPTPIAPLAQKGVHIVQPTLPYTMRPAHPTSQTFLERPLVPMAQQIAPPADPMIELSLKQPLVPESPHIVPLARPTPKASLKRSFMESIDLTMDEDDAAAPPAKRQHTGTLKAEPHPMAMPGQHIQRTNSLTPGAAFKGKNTVSKQQCSSEPQSKSGIDPRQGKTQEGSDASEQFLAQQMQCLKAQDLHSAEDLWTRPRAKKHREDMLRSRERSKMHSSGSLRAERSRPAPKTKSNKAKTGTAVRPHEAAAATQSERKPSGQDAQYIAAPGASSSASFESSPASTTASSSRETPPASESATIETPPSKSSSPVQPDAQATKYTVEGDDDDEVNHGSENGELILINPEDDTVRR